VATYGPWFRKLIHLGTALLLVLVPLAGWAVYRWVVLGLLGGAVLVEWLRRSHTLARRLFLMITHPMLKERERQGAWTDATLHLVGMNLVAWGFSPEVAIPALLVQALADPAAFAVGVRGRWRTDWGKSLEGSLAFALVTGALLWRVGVDPAVAVGVGVLVAGVEHVTREDNVWVPLTTAVLLWGSRMVHNGG